MSLRKNPETTGAWLRLAMRICLVSSGCDHPPDLHPALCKASHPDLSATCLQWLSKCQLWGKYHRAEPSWCPSLDSALGTHSPPRGSLPGSPGNENKQRQQSPGSDASALVAYTDGFCLKIISTPHFPSVEKGRADPSLKPLSDERASWKLS